MDRYCKERRGERYTTLGNQQHYNNNKFIVL